MYGFSISKYGILTDNYYKKIGEYTEPDPQGTYIMIRKNFYEIIINQDYHGSFGLYLYENKLKNYFALSNSFLLLEEYLIGKQFLSFNKNFADNLILSELCSFSLQETLINEITQVPTNSFIIINIQQKSLKINFIENQENTIPLESQKGLKILDEWMDKWGYIFRSLLKKTDNISFDLSGGFDSRILLSILLNSGIDMNNLIINTYKNKENEQNEESLLAGNISSKYGFQINNLIFDDKSIKWSSKDSLTISMYSKLGLNKEFYLKNKFLINPLFTLLGSGGEDLRGSPGYPVYEYLNHLSTRDIKDNKEKLFNSSMNLLNRSVDYLKHEKIFNNDYEIANTLYSKILGRNHIGKASLESFIANIYFILPLMDPEIRKIKFKINENEDHDFMAYIFIRYAPDLIDFPFKGNKTINSESIKKAKILNSNFSSYTRKYDYNQDFFIDKKRKTPVSNINDQRNIDAYLRRFFKSDKYYNIVNEIYDINIYNFAKEYSNKLNSFPFRHEYGLLPIVISVEYIKLNEKCFKNPENKNCFQKKDKILNKIIK